VNQNKIDRLLVRLIENRLTAEETTLVENWLETNSNKEYFKQWIEINYLLHSKNQFDYRNSLAQFKLKTKTNTQRNFKTYFRYAAAILIFASVGYFATKDLFWNSNSTEEAIKELATTQIKTGSNKAVLTLGDGSVVILEKGNDYSNTNANSDGEKIIYNKNAKDGKSEIAFNYLTIPRGGEFYVKLADGTEVWLNSESQLKYPVAFEEGKIRQVELVYGEGYFEVSPSTLHKGARFKVLNKSQEVEVVGTEFNIKAYQDETSIYTTLIEGKVDVLTNNKKQRLQPNQQLNLNKETLALSVNTVDVYNEIAWKEGVFSFERKPLRDIMKVLSRWYDVDVVFKNKPLEEVKFYGILEKKQSITEILETIKKYKVIQGYDIKNKVVTLK
jgi:ferric-dicitrate binding protein FerR (iron transport regulator)